MKRPFVFINMAMTADGKIATANRVISSFGSKRDLEHLYELRTQADAVMAGARTIDAHEVLLGSGGKKYERMRLKKGLPENHLRVIVSGSGSINPDAAIFKKRFSPIIVITAGRVSTARLRRLAVLADDVQSFGDVEVDMPAALAWLRRRWRVERLLCEGGGELNDVMFRAGVVDELHLTLCPKIFGGDTAPSIAGGIGFPRLIDAATFELKLAKRIKDELFIIYRRRRNE